MPKEDLYAKDCIRTRSGLYVNVFEPDPETIIIEDIAHALAMQCRFGGHLPVMYTVAQHSYYCALSAPPEHRFATLMHDASEGYLLDVPSPIKKKLTGYRGIEDNLMKVIAQKFGFEYPLSGLVHEVDHDALKWEWHYSMLQNTIIPDAPEVAKEKFLLAFHLLKPAA